jgi:hypothetical protein
MHQGLDADDPTVTDDVCARAAITHPGYRMLEMIAELVALTARHCPPC